MSMIHIGKCIINGVYKNDGESVIKVAEDLGLNPKTLYHLVTAYKKTHNIPTRDIISSSSKESEHEEVKRLRRENKILKQERDIFLYLHSL